MSIQDCSKERIAIKQMLQIFIPTVHKTTSNKRVNATTKLCSYYGHNKHCDKNELINVFRKRYQIIRNFINK